MSSSVRGLPGSPVKTNGSLGTSGSRPPTLWNATAAAASDELADVGRHRVFEPPSINSSAVWLSVPLGTITCSQWCQTGLSTSAVVRQVWLIMS